ncbi:MAG: serine/threonine-protein kinase [Nannocystaceae bacterium]
MIESFSGGGSAESRSAGSQFPQVFGKYVLLRPMARGGMGELFLAAAGEVGGFEKLSVVKKVLQHLLDPAVRRRFLDEVKVVVRLNHANLVQVFDAGRVEQEYYLAMELVEGKDLRALWNRCAKLHRRIPVDLAIFVVREICRGLAYVHDAGSLDLVHRDISPPNILVGYRGEIKITDFGLAKHAIKREFTSPGVVYGRYSYLSPEQARGLPADRRSDVYASGIVLWEMLTGRQLFPAGGVNGQGPALSVLQHPESELPSSIVPGIPEGLDAVVQRALAPEREERYQTAEELRVSLSEILTRFYPSCDVDRVAGFMREIFARELKLETQEYAKFVRADLAKVRLSSRIADTLSIKDTLAIEDTQSMALSDSDIHELEPRARHTAWESGPSQASFERAATDRIDMVVGQRYRIDRLLGVGGMGAVYEATHLALGKSYALKILHDIYGRDPDIIDRFMREARSATQTGHPNIIDVTDIGTMESGDLYFVMELLEGTDLSDVIRQDGPLGVRRAVNIACQICRALGAAHDAGIIHRDLKSENVILTPRPQDPDFVKVLDFGICKQVDGTSSARTTPGMVMGSPDYMAPEQAAGLQAGAESDVYALGTILFEMLTARLPFRGRNAIDVLMQKAARVAELVTRYQSEIPSELAVVVARCLERDPAARISSMRQLEYELTRAMEGRASAVAAMIGLSIPDAEIDRSPGEVVALGSGVDPSSDLDNDPNTEVYTVHGETSGRVAAEVLEREVDAYDMLRSRWKPALRAAGLVVAGGLVVAALLTDWGDAAGSSSEGSHPTDGPRDGTPQLPSDEGNGATEPTQSVVPALRNNAAVPGGSEAKLPLAEDGVGAPDTDAPVPGAAALVAEAKKALAAGHWQEPVAGSLAMVLAGLAMVDPGNEALSILRKQAAKKLQPLGDRAVRRKQWGEAVEAYRDLLRVWPEHEVRADLVAALRRYGWERRRGREYAASLTVADEVLNLEENDFLALKLRADSLAGLKRWEAATAAYRAAMRQRPKNKDVRRAYWHARKKSKGGSG